MRIEGKIPLTIRLGFWVMAFLFGWIATASMSGTLIWVAVILISVLVHELGHAGMYLLFGQKSVVELTMFGGMTATISSKRPPLSAWQMILVELAGPIAGFLLAGCATLFGGGLDLDPKTLGGYALSLFVVLNLIWSVANLIPVLPLDGGQVLRTLMSSIFGTGSLRWSFLVSALISFSVAAGSLYLGYILGGLFFFLLGIQNAVSWWNSRRLSEADFDLQMRDDFEEALGDIGGKQYQEAEKKLRAMIAKNQDGMMALAAKEQLAQLLYRRGLFQEAYDLLEPMSNDLSQMSLPLLHEVAATLHHYDAVASIGDRVFLETPDESVALRNSLAYAALNQPDKAMSWFEAAWENGLPRPVEMLSRPEYDTIRKSAAFQRVIQTLEKTA